MSKKQKDKRSVTGVFRRHKNGFGFVEAEGKTDNSPDIYISPEDTHGAMNGDIVSVDLIPEYYWYGLRPEGIITKVIERHTKEVVGTFRLRRKGGIVFPADRKHGNVIDIPEGETSGASNGDKVCATIIDYPRGKSNAKGHISSIIARNGDAGADIKELISSKGIKLTFPSSVKAQASYIAKNNPDRKFSDEEILGRIDLRDRKVFTIDGSYSKDFDDAVSIEKLEDGHYLLGVHIADVSEYVTKDSPLDKEALKRGNSVYVLNEVVPMLPAELSNGICSLNEGTDRLTLSVEMKLDSEGHVADYRIFESVICSCHRMVYDDVSDILEKGDAELKKKYDDIIEDLIAMKELYEILSKARKERGCIDFDIDEAEIKLNKKGVPYHVSVVERRTANRLIEEFMLLANETVATHFYWLELPFIYRVHEKPETTKMQELKLFLNGLSIPLKGDMSNVHPKLLNSILEDQKSTYYENIVGTVILRCMQKAYYSTECGGHYGLSLTYYTHFTSPIRRYSDLFIHRIIKEYIHGKLNDEKIVKYKEDAAVASDIASKMERIAVETERDGEKMKKAEYMTGHIGEAYEAVISGITKNGFFVQLPNTIEGLVKFENIGDDYYDVDEKRHLAVGRNHKKVYSLGDKVKVVCIGASIFDYTVDFNIVSQKRRKSKKQRKHYPF